jgi:tryptophan synthase alpha chain
MSRLSRAFARRGKCFIPYVLAGYPDLSASEELIAGMAEAGADIVEIGIPFSDPVADGPVIQQAMYRALSHRHSIDDYLEMVSRIRRGTEAGLLMMSYANPIMHYGISRFDSNAFEAGLDGILISDLPPDEYDLIEHFNKLDTVFLAAPTSSDERLLVIARHSSAFIYVVARTGITGAHTDVDALVPQMVAKLRKITDIPIAVGFGINSSADAEAVWRHADGVVVGSAIIREIETQMILGGGTAGGVIDKIKRVFMPWCV